MTNQIFSEFLSYNLEKEGFLVETAENGKASIRKSEKEST
jgi:DNA-binding response OmpR family regulator